MNETRVDNPSLTWLAAAAAAAAAAVVKSVAYWLARFFCFVFRFAFPPSLLLPSRFKKKIFLKMNLLICLRGWAMGGLVDGC